MLLFWSLIDRHSFSPHRFHIRNNRDTLYKHKSSFLEHWFGRGSYLVKQLFNSNGVWMSDSELLDKFGFPTPPKEHALVSDAVPSGVMMLLEYSTAPGLTLLKLDPADTSVGQICFSTKKRNNNHDRRASFQKDIVSVPDVVSYWNSFTPDLNWKKIWCLPSKHLIINEIKEVSLQIIHRFYPCKLFLPRYKLDIDVLILQTVWRGSVSRVLVLSSCVFWQDVCTFKHWLWFFSDMCKCIV